MVEDTVTILALDPGESTGYAEINVTASKKLTILSYGVIPQVKPGPDGLVWSVFQWLSDPGRVREILVFEDFPNVSNLRTSRAASEVRGIIRLFCDLCLTTDRWFSIYPATIRSQLNAKNKAAIRKVVKRMIEMEVRGPDHVKDALAVALCYIIKLNLWQPEIDLRSPPAQGSRTSRRQRRKTADMSPQELKEMIKRGDIEDIRARR